VHFHRQRVHTVVIEAGLKVHVWNSGVPSPEAWGSEAASFGGATRCCMSSWFCLPETTRFFYDGQTTI